MDWFTDTINTLNDVNLLLSHSGHKAAAEKNLRNLLDGVPDCEKVFTSLVMVLLQQNKFDEAADLIKEHKSKIEDDCGMTNILLAIAKISKGEEEDGMDIFGDLISNCEDQRISNMATSLMESYMQ